MTQVLETAGIVWESVARIRSSRVSQKYTEDLSWKLRRHGRVIPHDIAVAGIRNEDEFSLRVRTEDLLEQILAHTECFFDVTEV